ncbi:MAG: HIT family protein [Alphaproteobacteria bacterium]|nr:HIT family protein [Alphaproteobacteria bacterium]
MIDERLTSSTFPVVELETCEVRLSREWSYPGRCLVIPTEQYRDIHEVDGETYLLMMGEVRFVSGVLARLYKADKMNVASFGNMGPWLHWHIIPRTEGDAGWPGTPWENPETPFEAPEETLADHADRISWALLDAEFDEADEDEDEDVTRA